MKLDVGLFFRKWAKSLLELLVFFPLLLYIGIVAYSEQVIWVWFIIVYLIFGLSLFIGKRLQLKQRWSRVLVAFVLVFFIAFLLLPASGPSLSLVFIFLVAVSMRAFYYSRHYIEDLVPVRLMWYGLLGYFFAYFFFRMYMVLMPYEAILNGVGVFYVVITLFYTNTRHLKEATLVNRVNPFLSKGTKRQNRLYLIGFIAFLLFVVGGRYIQETIRFLWSGFVYLITLISPDFSGESDFVPPAFEEDELSLIDLGGNSEVEGSVLWVNAFVLFFIFVTVLFFVILMLSKSKRFVSWLQKGINGFFSNSKQKDEEAFVDEKEKLMTLSDLRKRWQKRTKEWFQTKLSRKLTIDDFETNQEKVRFLFRQLMKKEKLNGFSIHKSDTAHELLLLLEREKRTSKKEFHLMNDRYNLARYGLDSISIKDKDVEQIKKWIDEISTQAQK
ncbi:hypothetical protein [Alkalihalobacillus sp. 1P02AB]|uniref:hypothetical protein n=1 Tax=Alkalihalobacillus sp. 1P02AB TaxID=3132260 RepID=UPI0039A43B04